MHVIRPSPCLFSLPAIRLVAVNQFDLSFLSRSYRIHHEALHLCPFDLVSRPYHCYQFHSTENKSRFPRTLPRASTRSIWPSCHAKLDLSDWRIHTYARLDWPAWLVESATDASRCSLWALLVLTGYLSLADLVRRSAAAASFAVTLDTDPACRTTPSVGQSCIVVVWRERTEPRRHVDLVATLVPGEVLWSLVVTCVRFALSGSMFRSGCRLCGLLNVSPK